VFPFFSDSGPKERERPWGLEQLRAICVLGYIFYNTSIFLSLSLGCCALLLLLPFLCFFFSQSVRERTNLAKKKKNEEEEK
jgi:hypothetical protein